MIVHFANRPDQLIAWPEFGQMLGAVEGSHGEPTEMATVKIDDPASPLVAAFGGKSFVHQDEFYRFVEGPLSRDKVHVLMSIGRRKDGSQSGQGVHATLRAPRR
jgi:hypothetical protein